jgi:DNA replication protein DnaC
MTTLQKTGNNSNWLNAWARAIPEDIQPIPKGVHVPQTGHCERHGDFNLSMVDDQGVVRYRSSICPVCTAEQASLRLMNAAAISPRHQHCRFETFRADTPAQKEVLEICREYAENFKDHAAKLGTCLVFTGHHGTGKNHLATAIARMVLESGRSVVQATAHSIIVRIRETWTKGGDYTDRKTENEVLHSFASADLLIIDEVGKQFGSKDEVIHLFEVINLRYLEMKPTIVLSNESVQGVENYLGTAAFDRLCEDGMLLEFAWPGYRRGRRSD